MRSMKEGTFIRTFRTRDDRTVILRVLKWSDLDDFLQFINSLVDEGADILVNTKKTREEEIDFVSRILSSVEKDRMVSVVAELDGRLIGHVEVVKKQGYSSHVGILGISIIQGYRGTGIGQELMLEAEAQAKRLGVELIELDVYERNKCAIHVYKKTGYKIIGKISKDIKRGDRYLDTLIMVKEIH